MRGLQRCIAVAWSCLLVFYAGPAVLWANPSGAELVYGQAVFDEAGGHLEITQNGGQLIIDWQDFSIGAGETTRFVQPSIDAVALNRVISGNLSQIQGQLQANGEVYLINPNGIIFGENARVDAAAFTASTLDVDNSDFLNGGDLTFSASAEVFGQIVNMGRLEAVTGSVTLISEVIINSGSITATEGSVNLAAGREVIVQPDSAQKVYISIPSDIAEIENSGLIEAARAEIVAAHSNPYALAINQSGIVRATGTEEIDGEVWLVAEGGTVDISGLMSAKDADNSGGEVFASGSRIGVSDGAEITAEGLEADGGRVRIGGSRRGQDDTVFHADQTYIAEGADISVDASGADSTAGTIITWGNDTLRMFGDLSARGLGSAAGGFIETSAGWFDLGDSVPDVGSDQGAGGEWLIDPYNINITNNGLDEFGDTTNPFDNPNTDDAELDRDTIEAALAGGVGVTVRIETGGGGSQDGNINMNADIDIDGIGTGDTLWLKAHNDIELGVNDEISDSDLGSVDNLNVVLQSDSDGSGFGSVVLRNGGSIYTYGGEVIISGGDTSGEADEAAELAYLRTTGFTQGTANSSERGLRLWESAEINTGAGNITIRTDGASGVGMFLQGDIVTTTGNVTLVGTTEGPGNSGVVMDGTFSITSSGGDVSITGTGNSDNSGGFPSAHGIEIRGATITLTGDSTLTMTGTGSQEVNDDGNVGIYFNTTGSSVSVENGNMILNGTGGIGSLSPGIYFTDDGSILSTGSGNISIDGTSNGAGIGIASDGTYTIGGGSMSGDITLTAGTVSGADSFVIGANMTFTTSGTVAFQTDTDADTIGIGDSATGLFNLSAEELAGITDGTAGIIIGSTTGTGAIDVEALTFTDDVLIRSLSGDIDIDGALSVGANNLRINTGGTVTQSAAITAGGLSLNGSGAKTLENASNYVDTLAISGGETSFVDTDDLVLGSVTVYGITTNGITVGANDVSLETGGALTQTQAIAATGLVLLGSGTKTLENTSNDVDNIAATGGSLSYVDDDDVAINDITVNGTTTSALSVSGDVTIDSGRDIEFAASIDYDGTGTGNTLWLKAERDIKIQNYDITDESGSDDSLNLVFQADSDGSADGGYRIQDATITTNGGEIIISGGDTSAFGSLADELNYLRTAGMAGNGPRFQRGAAIDGATALSTGTGDITIRAASDDGNGITLDNTASITTTTGDITLYGSGYGVYYGFRMDNSNAAITTSGGDVSITGISDSANAGSNLSNRGVYIEGDITVSGDAVVTISGTASQQPNDTTSAGVELDDTADIQVENGDLIISGTGGFGSTAYGVEFNGDANLVSTGTGNISITGLSSGTAQGIFMASTSSFTLGSATMTGDITLIAGSGGAADSITLDTDLTIDTSGTVFLRPVSASEAIGIGDSATGVFNLDAGELGTIADGAATIVIGGTDGTGAIDVEALTFTDDLLLRSLSGDIDIDGALSVGSNDLGIETGGTVSQSAAITAGGLVLTGSGTKTLENSSNDADIIAASGGTVSFVDDDDFDIGDVTVNGTTTSALSVSGDTTLEALDGNINFASSIDYDGTGTGNTLWLKAENDILTQGYDIIDGSGSDDSLNVVFQADSDASGDGGIRVDDANITTNGGEILFSGGDTSGEATSADELNYLRTTGATGNGPHFNRGVHVHGTSALSSGVGNVTIRGVSSGGEGVQLSNSATITTTTGDVTLYGSSGNSDNGVNIDNSSNEITTSGGSIVITGIANSTGSTGSTTAHGVRIEGNITGTGSSTLNVAGTGSQQASDDDNYGVYFDDNADVILENGDVFITGIGGNGANGHGIYFNNDSELGTTGSGSVTLDGTSNGDAYGIFSNVTGSSNIIGSSTMTGNITLIAHTTSGADSILLDTLLEIDTGGTVYLQSGNASSTIGLGDGAIGEFNLGSNELATIQDGTTAIVIGGTDGTGAFDVEALTFTDDVLLRSLSGDIDIDGALSVGANNLGIDTGGSVTQSAAITATGLALLGGGTKTLQNASNDVDTLASDGAGAITFDDADDLTIDSVTVNGTTTSGLNSNGNITVATLTGDLTLDTDSDTDGANGATWWFKAADDVLVNGNVIIDDSSGSDDAVNIVAQSDSDGSGAGGIQFSSGSQIISNGGEILLSGGNYSSLDDLRALGLAAGTSNSGNYGVRVNSARLESGVGNITIRGQGGLNDGVRMENSFVVSSTTGDISVYGEAANVDDVGVGIAVGSITSSGGAVSITGFGESSNILSDRDAHGISVYNGADITLTGASSLRLDGTASQQVNIDDSYGVLITGSGTTVSVENGDMTIEGTGSRDLTGYGVVLADEAIIQSTGTGDISITGTSEDSLGIYTDSASAFTIGGASMTGDIYLIADDTTDSDSILLDTDLTIQTSGTVYLQPGSAGETIGIGNSATGDFNLDAGELGTIADGAAAIVIGRSDGTGAIDVEALTWNDPLTIQALTGEIGIDGTQTMGANDLTLSSDSIDLGVASSVSGSGILTIRPGQTNTNIGLGDGAAGTLSLSSTEIGNISDGFDTIVIGRSDGTGAVDVEASTFADDVSILSSSGSIDIDGALNVGTNSLSIVSDGLVSQSAAITASGLSLSGAGTKTLDNALNDVDTLASSGGSVSYTDADGFSVGSVSVDGVSIDGISTAGTLTLSTSGTVTQAEAISASTLTLNGTGGVYTLLDTSNDIDTLIGNTGTVSLTEDDGLSLGTINATTLDLTSTGTITNSGAITVSSDATFKTLNDAGATITLDNAGNAFGTVSAQVRNSADSAARGADISLTNTGDLVLGAITTTGSFALTADGIITQSDAIKVDTLSLLGSGTYTLENASNAINEIGNVSRGGNFSLYDSSGGLNISGSFTGTLTNSVSIRTVGDLSMGSGASVLTSGSGNNITLEASGGSFINNAGASALTTDSRFLIYSQNSESPHEKGGLSGEEVYGVSYESDPQGSGNVFYYSEDAPTVEEPVSDDPVEEDPVSEDPITEEPVVDEPEPSEEPVEDTIGENSDEVIPVDESPSNGDSESDASDEVSVLPSNTLSELITLEYLMSPDEFSSNPEGEASHDAPEHIPVSLDIVDADSWQNVSYRKPPEPLDYFDEKLDIEIISVESGTESTEESSD
ncbi:MAG: filamentous hemagglutinin N-terminal domain-containing protein [Opitutales bacterium]